MTRFDLDSIQSVVELSVLNLLVTIPVFLGLSILRGSILWPTHSVGILVVIGLVRRLNLWLSDQAQNNWVDDKYDWSKEFVVITGGSQGIGAAVVKELESRKVKVIIVDIVDPKSGFSGTATPFYRCDLSSSTEIRATTAAIQKEHGDPTVLFNNAGTWNRTSTLQTSDQATARIFQINHLSNYQLIRSFLPAMVARNHGMIVTMSSVIAYGTAPPAMVDYAACKAANMALHEGIGSEIAMVYQAPKVRTVLVVPNFTKTGLTAGISPNSLLFRQMEPEELGSVIASQILSGRSGQVLLPKCVSWTEAYLRALPVWMQKIRANNP